VRKALVHREVEYSKRPQSVTVHNAESPKRGKGMGLWGLTFGGESGDRIFLGNLDVFTKQMKSPGDASLSGSKRKMWKRKGM